MTVLSKSDSIKTSKLGWCLAPYQQLRLYNSDYTKKYANRIFSLLIYFKYSYFKFFNVPNSQLVPLFCTKTFTSVHSILNFNSVIPCHFFFLSYIPL